MSQLIVGLFFLLLFLAFWAATGHGLWLICTSILRRSSKKLCPECSQHLTESDMACCKCGWTSRAMDRTTAMRVCTQALQAALNRGLIDKEAFDRGVLTLTDLDRSLAGNIAPPIAKPAVDTSPTATLPEPLPEVPSIVPQVLAAVTAKPATHALDQEYPNSPVAVTPPLSRIKQTWGKWLSAFMEEKHIQWGELAGGLLILCCSTALVLSFWEHIASRPWLKFCIFTGINAATLGLGLNAWHRWKLPTTSRGILMIGLLLLPLNFLAFAIFTLGVPWDWWTVTGEVLSIVLLGCLAWFSAITSDSSM